MAIIGPFLLGGVSPLLGSTKKDKERLCPLGLLAWRESQWEKVLSILKSQALADFTVISVHIAQLCMIRP